MGKNKFQFGIFLIIFVLGFSIAGAASAQIFHQQEKTIKKIAKPLPTKMLPLKNSLPENEKPEGTQDRQKTKKHFLPTNIEKGFKKTIQIIQGKKEIQTKDEKGMANQKKVLKTFAGRVENYVNNVFQRFYALIKRETQIKGRIDTRIIKLAEKDLDMTAATLAIESAEKSLKTIEEQVKTLRSDTKDALESSATNARELFADFRQQTFLLKKAIRNVHIQLVQSVKAMREVLQKEKENKVESSETEE